MKYIEGIGNALGLILGIALIRQYSGLADIAGWLFVVSNTINILGYIYKEARK